MPTKPNNVPIKIVNHIFGIVLGLFLGLLIFGTIIRLTFSFLFGWQDSAPFWGILIEVGLIIGVTALTTFHTTNWCIRGKSR